MTSAENEAVRKASGFLEQGILAGRFSHDVSSPLSIIHFASEHFAESEVRSAFSEADEEMLELMAEATERLIRESRRLAAAIRGTTKVEEHRVDEWVLEAVKFSRLTGARIAGASDFKTVVRLDDAVVKITEQHVGALADIISNAVRASPTTPVEITGRSNAIGLYEISIRDHGVETDQQVEACARVQAVLDLDATTVEDTRTGLGIGLSIAKLTAVRYGGALKVEIPEGRGLMVTMVLPLGGATEDTPGAEP